MILIIRLNNSKLLFILKNQLMIQTTFHEQSNPNLTSEPPKYAILCFTVRPDIKDAPTNLHY